jgi:flagellar motor switch protein FliN/FliY
MSDGFVSSDGSLTQDEIDALLGGGEGDVQDDFFSGMGNTAPSGGMQQAPMGVSGATQNLSGSERNTLLKLFQEVIQPQSSTLSGMVGGNVVIKNPQVDVFDKEGFLQVLPDEVVETRVPFTSGLSGDHILIFNPETAMRLAEPLIGHGELFELDDTAVNVIQEAVSMISGSALTTMSDRTGSNIMTGPAESEKIPKAMLSLPGEDFVRVSYTVAIEGKGDFPFYEIFELSDARKLASLLGAEPAQEAPRGQMGGGRQQQQQPMGGMGGMQQPQMQQQPPMQGYGMQGMPGMQQGYGMPPQGMPGMQPGYGMQGMPGMQPGYGMQGMPGYAMGGMQAPNVQGIQFPSFESGGQNYDQGNISLLMDVFMEVTVELGRTKKQIKDILGMGEGTIIELDKLAGEAVDILVNGHLIARGEVVVIDENFGVRVTDIVSQVEGKMNE